MGDQAERLREMLGKKQTDKQAKTIAVASGKGGVGKSNISLNIALELVNQGHKVLLFDMDIGMGNIDILLGLDTTYSIVDLFQKDMTIQDIIAETPGGLSYISGGAGLNQLFIVNEEKRMLFFDEYARLLKLYDYIIMDMGAGATADSLLFILAADECMIITTPEPTAITDAYSMIKHMVKHGFDKQLFVIMNRMANGKQDLKILSDFKSVVKQFLHTDITMLGSLPDDKFVSKSVMKQTPFLIANDKAPASRAIKQIVRHYISQMEEQPVKRVTFINKLKQLMKERS